jgi:hypothetical protein
MSFLGNRGSIQILNSVSNRPAYLGGIAGFMAYGVTLEDSYFAGYIKTSFANVAGLVSLVDGPTLIKRSYAVPDRIFGPLPASGVLQQSGEISSTQFYNNYWTTSTNPLTPQRWYGSLDLQTLTPGFIPRNQLNLPQNFQNWNFQWDWKVHPELQFPVHQYELGES